MSLRKSLALCGLLIGCFITAGGCAPSVESATPGGSDPASCCQGSPGVTVSPTQYAPGVTVSGNAQ